jgi:hypothetical protein
LLRSRLLCKDVTKKKNKKSQRKRVRERELRNPNREEE